LRHVSSLFDEFADLVAGLVFQLRGRAFSTVLRSLWHVVLLDLDFLKAQRSPMIIVQLHLPKKARISKRLENKISHLFFWRKS
jgi:hypothetical protein